MTFYLILDKGRERKVTPYIYNEINQNQIIEKQLAIGDYLIIELLDDDKKISSANEEDLLCSENIKVHACIERKSLNDFASSIADGRYYNKKNMMELRMRTECKLFYIVEGAGFPDYSTTYGKRNGGIPYSTLWSAQ